MYFSNLLFSIYLQPTIKNFETMTEENMNGSKVIRIQPVKHKTLKCESNSVK